MVDSFSTKDSPLKPKSRTNRFSRGQQTRRPSARQRTPALGYASVAAGLPLDGPEAHGQRVAIEESCEELGLELVDFLSDEDRNGSQEGMRAGLAGALQRFESGEASCLIVTGLERLSSTVPELASIIDRLEKQRIRLIALDVGLDTATPTGRLAISSRHAALEPEPVEPEPVEPEPLEPEPVEPEPVEPQAVEPEAAEPQAVEAEPVDAQPAEPQIPEARPEPDAQPAVAAEAEAPLAPAPSEAPAGGREAEPPQPAAPTLVRAFGYASVQPGDEALEELEAQRQAVEQKCADSDFELIELIRDREPKGGKAFDRPGLSYLLGRIAAGEASCLVVNGLERLSRSVAELGSLVRWCEQNNVRLVVVELDLDTSTPGGKTTARALASVGGWERERLSERTRQGLAAARAKRRAATGPSQPDWVSLRKRIAAMRADGMTLQAIADILNEEGVPTQRGGAKWRPSSVQTAAGYKRRSKPSAVDELPTVKRPDEPRRPAPGGDSPS
jgi:DNA invertase Pin-like site-specific DNA recombinase